jgi:hypothetical protein
MEASRGLEGWKEEEFKARLLTPEPAMPNGME